MESAPDENPEFSTNAADWTVDAIYERAHAGARAASPGQEEAGGEEPPQIARLRTRMGEDAFQQLQAVFARLDALAADPSYGRRLRKLERPEAVTFSYTGRQDRRQRHLQARGNGEYAGEITGLKEDVRFVVKAEDYRTRPKPITLIPPPTLTKLAQVSFQPAYLHYAKPVDEGYAALRGLRQRMAEERLSLTGDKSIFEVPSGTEVILTGTTEEPIAGAWVVPKVGQIPGAKPGSAAPVALKITDRSREHGTRPLRWSEVTDALLGVRVPEFRLPRFLGTSDSRSAAVDPAAVVADDVVNWIRNDAGARDHLRAALGDAEFHALERAIAGLSPAAAAAVKSASPYEALERRWRCSTRSSATSRADMCSPWERPSCSNSPGIIASSSGPALRVRSRLSEPRPRRIDAPHADPRPRRPAARGRTGLGRHPPRRQRLLRHAEGQDPVRQRHLRQGRQRPLQAGIHLHALPRGFGDRALDADRAS